MIEFVRHWVPRTLDLACAGNASARGRRDGRSGFTHEETIWHQRGCWRRISLMLERAYHVRSITTRPRLMTVAFAYPHIEKPPGEPARLKRIPRVRVAQIVMEYLAHGSSPDEMCRQHVHLRLAEAHAL